MKYMTLFRISAVLNVCCLFYLFSHYWCDFAMVNKNFVTYKNLVESKNVPPDEINKLNSPLAEKIKTPNYLFKLNKTTTCYEIDNKPIIWIYWDKAYEIPVFGRILLDSIQCVNMEFHVLVVHDSSLKDFWPDCPWDLFNKLITAHKADVIRVNLLKRFGGIYMDIDTFPLESFYMYYEMLKDYDLVGADWLGTGPIAVGFLGPARADQPFFHIWSIWQLECMKKIIYNNTEQDPFAWSELSAWIAGPLALHMIRNKVLNYYGFRGYGSVGQLIMMDLAHAMMVPLLNISYRMHELYETPILFVHHVEIAQKLDILNFSDLLFPNRHTVFTYFVKCAIIKCYNNGNYFAGSKVTEIGKLPINDYVVFVDSNPLPYRCYKFSGKILPKIVIQYDDWTFYHKNYSLPDV